MKNKAVLPIKLIRFSVLILSILLTAKVVFASGTTESECSPIDHREKVGPIRDQGNIGWCYANAAADLLGYEYKDQLNGRQASAMYMALTYTDTFMADLPVIGKSFFEGGSAALALKAYAIKNDKVCLQSVEEKVLTQGLRDKNNQSISITQKLDELMLLKSTFDDFAKDRSKKAAFTDQWLKLKKNNSYLFSMGDKKLIHLLAYSSARDFPHNVADTLCGDSAIPVKQNSPVEVMLGLKNDFLKSKAIKNINKQLENYNNIVSLTYFASVLVNPKPAIEVESAHVSVLVGRKWNKDSNQCEYLIRNSWGKGCYAYRNSSVFKPRCEGDGHIWIPESIMKKSMIGISYFDKSKSLSGKIQSTMTTVIGTAVR